MRTYLGIDLGTTYTAAAVHDGEPRRRPEMVPLGERGPTVPSVLWLGLDGRFVAGDAAERRAVTDPERVARQFKRRLGDPTPLLVGETSVPAEVLTGRLLHWVVERAVQARGGERPAELVLTHPANWGPYKRDLLGKAAEIAGVPGVVLVTEPQAAAISYASQERVDEGAVVAVYDLGGGTFDAAVLRKDADGGFTVLGSPEGIERLGGIDVDAAVFAHVMAAAGDPLDDLDPDDPQAMAAVARLRDECTMAKESLSLDSETSVPVLLPTVQTEVRLARSELEALVRPALGETVTALERALRSAAVSPGAVDHVLLVGGSSRIPLVSQLVSSGLGRPVAVDAHPKHAVALGAAIVAARVGGALPPVGRLPPPPGMPPAAPAPSRASVAAPTVARRPPPTRPAPPQPSTPAAVSRPAPPPAAASVPTPRPTPPRPAPPVATGAPAAPPGPGPPGPPPPARPPAARGGASTSAPPPPGRSGELPPGFLTGEARQRRQRADRRRRRLSIGLGVLVLLVAIGATVALTARSNEKTTVADLAVGDCFNGDANDASTVGCEQQHRYELFSVVEAVDPSIPYPGAEPARTDGGNLCRLALVEFYGAPNETAAADGLDIDPVSPSEDQWNDGETETYCLVFAANGNALQGSMRGKGAG